MVLKPCKLHVYPNQQLLNAHRQQFATFAWVQGRGDLHAVSAWASNWNTKFHPLKSSQITFQRNGHHSDHGVLSECIYIYGIAVPRTTERCMHIRTTIHHQNHRVFILKRLAYRTSYRDLVSIMYKGLARPILEYAAVVWDACPKSDVIALERPQLSVARTILRLSRRSTSNIDVLHAIGWPTLAWRRRRLKLLCLWRLMHGDGPPVLRARLPSSASARTDYSFRNPKSLASPSVINLVGLRHFFRQLFYCGISYLR